MAKITIKKDIEPKIKVSNEKFLYNISLKYNKIEDKFSTNDIRDILKRFKYNSIKTNVVIKIETGKLSCERLLLVNQIKLILRSKLGIEIFINRLIFK